MKERPRPASETKQRITEDWQRVFGDLGIVRPMWLMKRHGPLVFGVCLDRTRVSSRYVPKAHVHNLLARSPVVTLSLECTVPDPRRPIAAWEIECDQHEASFRKAAEALKTSMPDLASRTAMTLSRVLQLYNQYLIARRNPLITRYPMHLFGDVILLTFWAGYHEYAQRCLRNSLDVMRAWPAKEEGSDAWGIDVASWRDSIESELDRVHLDVVVEQEVERHKLAGIPCYGLNLDSPPEPSIVDVYLEVSGRGQA